MLEIILVERIPTTIGAYYMGSICISKYNVYIYI